MSLIKQNRAYLDLGPEGICLNFSCTRFAEQAGQHIFLTEKFNGRKAGSIEYIEDDSVKQMNRVPGKPNVVQITREEFSKAHYTIVLHMFDKHTIVISAQENRITIRYPSDAPVRLMLDDVLQAALQPILDKLGGFILHGSCVAHEENAIVFMGNSGSGKSTTAFNLIRFGFDCYSDDAVLVTPVDDALWVWPLAREFSIRPLSFKLFREHGVNISGYKKDGEKYYFSQSLKKHSGAILKHICFVEVNGETGTFVTRLDPEQTLKILLKENRHFSFMGRQSARSYSGILAKKVPAPLKASVGTDMDSQSKAFIKIIKGHDLPSGKKNITSVIQTGREKKIALIRQAWSDNGQESLDEIIPLLGDYDLKIFTLALGFFQTYPLARIEPVDMPLTDGSIYRNFEALWLRADIWLKGSRQLLQNIDIEVLERFAVSWIKSAPLIYPFLKILAFTDPDKSEKIDKAWKCYKEEKTDPEDRNYKYIGICLSNFQNVFAEKNLIDHNSQRFRLFSKKVIPHIFCWITQDEQLNQNDMKVLFNIIGHSPRLTVVPVALKNKKVLTTSIEFIKFALQYGLSPKVYRSIPLCHLDEKDAHFLVNSAVFGKNSKEAEIYCNDRDISFPEKPYSACKSCGLYFMGLCRGGFFAISKKINQAKTKGLS